MLEFQVDDDGDIVTLRFEHSLLSLSKWESKHKIPFLGKDGKTARQLIDYFEDMVLDDADTTLVYLLSPEQQEELTAYISDSQTASSVPTSPSTAGVVPVITSELIYYWLSALQIPFHPTESWHVNRIMMLVQIANFYNQDPNKNKRSDKEVMQDWRQENERRKALFNTKG